jgi:hypothetical protein
MGVGRLWYGIAMGTKRRLRFTEVANSRNQHDLFKLIYDLPLPLEVEIYFECQVKYEWLTKQIL